MVAVSVFTLVPGPTLDRPGVVSTDAVSRAFASVLDDCAEAEKAGFRGVFFGEHHFDRFSVSPSPHLLIAAAAQQTCTLKLGTMVTPTALHHTWRIAEEAVMLDYLTHGRFEIGLGSGLSSPALERRGIPSRHDPQEFRGAVREILAYWTSGADAARDLDGGGCALRSLTFPHPPMWLPTATVEAAEWAGRLGAGIVCAPPDTATCRAIGQGYRDAFKAHSGGTSQPRIAFRRRVSVTTGDGASAATRDTDSPDLVVGGIGHVRAVLESDVDAIGATELLLWLDYGGHQRFAPRAPLQYLAENLVDTLARQ